VGGVIILLAVLFFVSVYGVREGFGPGEMVPPDKTFGPGELVQDKTNCDTTKTYPEPTIGQNRLNYYSARCNTSSANANRSNLSPINAYYGTPASTGAKLTQFKTYNPCENTSGNWTWETACSR
jgi:hypothetical protein